MAAQTNPKSLSETATAYWNAANWENISTFCSDFASGCAKQAKEQWDKIPQDTQKAILVFSKPVPGIVSIATCPWTAGLTAVAGSASATGLLFERVTGFMVGVNKRLVDAWNRSTPKQRVIAGGISAVVCYICPPALCVPASYLAGKMGADYTLGNRARAAQANAAPAQALVAEKKD
jgi:hypothetical protein